MQVISKSQFKPQVLAYLRQVEKNKQTLIITHAGRPVVQVKPYHEDLNMKLKELRNTVTAYKNPTDPVGENDWDALQ